MINNEDCIELLRLIAPITDFDYLDHGMKLRYLTACFWGEAHLLAWLLRESGCSFQNLSISERMYCSTNLLFTTSGRIGRWQPDAARLVRLVFENMKLDATVCKTTDYLGRSLIHGIAWNLSGITAGPHGIGQLYIDPPHCSPELLSLLHEVIRANSNLHGLAFQSVGGFFLQTPLLMACFGAFWPADMFPVGWRLEKVIKSIHQKRNLARSTMIAWLEQLQTMGIDLLDYGRKEKELHMQEKVAKEYLEFYSPCREFVLIRLISFTYGPEPADWHFWFTEVMPKIFIQFWDMVDHPERSMPGAWIEDDEGGNHDFPYDLEYDSPQTFEDTDRWRPSDENPWPIPFRFPECTA